LLNLLISTATLTLVALARVDAAGASSCPVPLDVVKEQMVQESISRYPSPCPCPYFLDRTGQTCGHRALAKTTSPQPLCYAVQITDAQARAYCARGGLQ
jgi:hypothetical protein